MKISVITATFNRGKYLEDLYQSLLKNINQGLDIEWLIMDDGSTDDTEEVIKKFETENIEIRHWKQENKGKMAAINFLVEQAKGDLIVDCDSDDSFTDNAFQIIQQTYKEKKDKENIYGFCFLKQDREGKNIGKNFQKDENTMFDLYFKEGEDGEKAIVFYANIRKQYQHKLEKNEKFITEARMYHEMDEKYKLICMNEPIMICEYQIDGYTKNIQKQFLENPYGYYEYFKEILERKMKGVMLSKRLYSIKHYILFSYLTKQYHKIKIHDFENKLLYYLLFIPGILKSRQFKNRK